MVKRSFEAGKWMGEAFRQRKHEEWRRRTYPELYIDHGFYPDNARFGQGTITWNMGQEQSLTTRGSWRNGPGHQVLAGSWH